MISPPGHVAEPTQAWSDTVSKTIDQKSRAAMEGAEPRGQPPPFYNPVREQLQADEVRVTWPALSGTLRALDHLTREQRWELADGLRLTGLDRAPGAQPIFGQDEYCEWSVTRNPNGDIMAVTFTSEVGEWFDHLAATDRDGLVELYKELTGEHVEEHQLFDGENYNWQNEWNSRTDGPIVHLAQGSNNFGAAIELAAEASVMRTRDGEVVTDTAALMDCQGLGAKDRFSDPSIATTINGVVAGGSRIALADPPGLYLAGIRTEGMRLPSGHGDLRASDLWHPERGDSGHVVRARFAAPNGAFPLSHVLVDGRPIRSGGQLAERVDIQIRVLVNDARQQRVRKPCRGG